VAWARSPSPSPGTSAGGTGNLTASDHHARHPGGCSGFGHRTIPTTGPYDITETLPTVAGGTWTLVTAASHRRHLRLSGTTLTVTPTSTATPLCLFINNFDPPGIDHHPKDDGRRPRQRELPRLPAANDAQEFSQIATTTVQGQPATGPARDPGRRHHRPRTGAVRDPRTHRPTMTSADGPSPPPCATVRRSPRPPARSPSRSPLPRRT